ncbi:MAG: hypothetical protein LBK05_04990 [Treponema sp.]|jgi:hypothetical protein|nr:hypothetical protein [Treponema sp.]
MHGSARNLLVGLCLFLTGTALFGRDPGPVFYPAGVFPAPGSIGELKVLQDGLGHVYVLYAEDGRFRALKADGLGALEPYYVEGLGREINGVRQLELSVFGMAQYASFVGSLNGSEGVFVLGLDDQGALRYCPAPEIQALGVVSKYFITASPSKGAAVFVLSGGRLSCAAGIGGAGGVPVYTMISGGSERIGGPSGFDVMADFRYPLGRGWFTVDRGEKQEAVIFSLDNDFLVRRKSIGSYTGDLKLRNSMNIEGDSIITVINEKHVEVYESKGSDFLRRRSFNAPGTGTVSGFAAPLGSFGILAVKAGDTEAVYGVKNAGTNAPLFEMWFNASGEKDTALFYESADRLLLAGKRDDGWYVMSLDSRGAVTGEEHLGGTGPGGKLFAGGARDRFRLYFFGSGSGPDSDSDCPVVTIYENYENYEKQGAAWRVIGEAELPPEIAAGDADWDGRAEDHPLFLEDRLIPLNSRGGTLVFETGPGSIRLLKNDAVHASRNINGTVYCAVHDGGEIALFRIKGAD